MDKRIQQLIVDGATPSELCREHGVCTSFAEGRRLIHSQHQLLKQWIQNTLDLNPDAGMISAARGWVEMHDLDWNDQLEGVVFNLIFEPEA